MKFTISDILTDSTKTLLIENKVVFYAEKKNIKW